MGTRLPSLLLLVTLGIGVILSWPTLLHPSTLAPLTAFTEGHLLAIGLGAEQFPDILFTKQLGWPNGVYFRPLLWPSLPLAMIFGPVVSFNLLYWTAPLSGALGGLALGRSLGMTPAQQTALGGLLAWNTWVYNTLANGQIEQCYMGAVALIWAAALKSVDQGGPWLLVSGLLTLAFGLAAPHTLLVAALGIVGLALVDCLRWAPKRWGFWVINAVLMGSAALGVLRYHSPAVAGAMSVFSPKSRATGYVAPWQFEDASLQSLIGWQQKATGEGPAVIHSTSLGWVCLGAVACGLFFWKEQRRYKLMFFLSALICINAAMGLAFTVNGASIPTLLGLMAKFSPTIERSASTYRMAMGGMVSLSVLAALAVRGPRSAILLVLLAWIEVGVVRTRGIPMRTAAVFVPDYTASLSSKTGPILDLPINDGACPEAVYHYALASTAHHRPLYHTLRLGPEAYGSFMATTPLISQVLAAPDCSTRLPELLKRLAPESIVLHKDTHCRVPTTAESCLDATLGPGQQQGQHVIWE